MTDYIDITWSEVRKGDVLRHENGDHVTVKDVQFGTQRDVYVLGQWRVAAVLEVEGFAPYRKAEPVPTADGTYVSREDWGRRRPSAVTLYSHQPGASAGPEWEWTRSEVDGWVKVDRADLPDGLVRLVPMPTEEQVGDALCHFVDGTIEFQKARAAVMSLLEGETDG